MAWKADNSQASLSVAAHGVTSIDGGALAADVQGVEVVTANGDAATRVNGANPFPVAEASDVLFGGGAALAINYAQVDVAASQTDAVVVSLVAAKRIYVLSLICICGPTATDATFRSSGSAVAAPMRNGANSGVVLPFNKAGWFRSALGAALNVSTGAGSPTGITLSYVAY